MSTAEARAFIEKVRPFDVLNGDELARVAEQLTPGRFAPGELILRRWSNPSALFVVADGLVEEADQAGPVALYSQGDSFDSMGLIRGRSEHSFVARNSSTCYLLPARMFHALSRSNPRFRDHYQRDVGRRLDTLVAAQQQREASSFLLAKIGEGNLHPPVFVGPETTIKQATQFMQMREATAVLVRDGERIGIFTERDVRERMVLMGLPETTPIGGLANYDLITLDREDFLFNALVLMTERAIRHVVVTRGGEIEGLFEQADLLGYLSNSSYVIASKVDRAITLEDLKAASDAIPKLIRSLFERGVKPRYIARIVNDLNRKTFRRVFTLIAPAEMQGRCCLMVMGSEGRGEQLLRTDQDNGLIFRDEPDMAERDAFAGAFSQALTELGYPPCPGNVMVSNPEWAKSLDAYKLDLRRWVSHPSGDAFLKLAILIDASAVPGDGALLSDLKAHLLDLVKREEAFCGHFAKATLAFATPLGFFNRFLVEEGPNGIKGLDIKKGGIFPVVHGVRSLALEYRVAETNTISRVQALSGRGPFSEGFTADLIEAFDFMVMLRLREQFAALDRGESYGNIIDVAHLGSFERNLLRDSLKIVKQFKSDVAHHFRLQLLT
jgi:CBS domain-containing protein